MSVQITLPRSKDVITLLDYIPQSVVEASSEAMQSVSLDIGATQQVTDDDVLTFFGADDFHKYTTGESVVKERMKNEIRKSKSAQAMNATITMADVNRSNRVKAIGMIEKVENSEGETIDLDDIDIYLGKLSSGDYTAILERITNIEANETERGNE